MSPFGSRTRSWTAGWQMWPSARRAGRLHRPRPGYLGTVVYSSPVTTMDEALEAARVKINSARHAVEGDVGASPVLAAVVNEFAKKADKAVASADKRVAVVELEQAGDSAKAAAEADPGVSQVTRDAVLEAHLVICVAKSKLDL